MDENRERERLRRASSRVSEILHYCWDPIGIAGDPYSRNEYEGYVPLVLAMLIRGEGKEAIASHLTFVATSMMGLSDTTSARAHDLKIAEQLIKHFVVIDEGFAG